MENVKFAFLMFFALIGEGLGRIARKFGLEEKWEEFTDWLKEDSSHAKVFAGILMVVLSLLILLVCYGWKSKPDL